MTETLETTHSWKITNIVTYFNKINFKLIPKDNTVFRINWHYNVYVIRKLYYYNLVTLNIIHKLK